MMQRSTAFVFFILAVWAVKPSVCDHFAKILVRRDVKTSYSEVVTGTVYIKQLDLHQASFRVVLQGLNANSVHGIHIHDYGDILTDGCKTTGGHYNPGNKNHGGPTSYDRHAGDLGNIKADGDGNLDVIFSDSLANLSDDDHIYGRAFVIHQDRDDFHTQPSGNAGNRIACGLVAAAPESEVNANFPANHVPKGAHLEE